MTKPRTVPSTVRIAFETDSLCVVISDTSETTVSVREIEHTSTYHEVSTEKMSDSLAATAVKNSTSGQISLMTVALNRLKRNFVKVFGLMVKNGEKQSQSGRGKSEGG